MCSAAYTHLGTDYYERRASIRRRARNHLRGLQRLGYEVTIEPIDPPPEKSKPPPANVPAHPEADGSAAGCCRAHLKSHFRVSHDRAFAVPP